MPSFYFKKLVRDQVLQRCLDDPKVRTDYKILNTNEFKKELIAKIHEEAAEIPVTDTKNDEVLFEIADVQAAIDALTESYGYTKKDIEAARTKKEAKNGAFEKQAYVEKVELDDDSEWVEYFRKSPDKYEEILITEPDDSLVVPLVEAGVYEHYKGKRYEVIGVGLDSEKMKPVVVYIPLYESSVPFWVRPYEMFLEFVEVDGKKVERFKKVNG